MYHEPVLLREAVEGLNVKKNGVYVDATFGGGGHVAAAGCTINLPLEDAKKQLEAAVLKALGV